MIYITVGDLIPVQLNKHNSQHEFEGRIFNLIDPLSLGQFAGSLQHIMLIGIPILCKSRAISSILLLRVWNINLHDSYVNAVIVHMCAVSVALFSQALCTRNQEIIKTKARAESLKKHCKMSNHVQYLLREDLYMSINL